MKLTVVHDARGEIVSVASAQPARGDAPEVGVGPWPDRGQRVLELDVSDELATLAPMEIAERYHVDPEAGTLTERHEKTS
jgi:hypothetical protein